jgi:3-carboxy-cis,cis-muconate cycloisomerase
VTFSALDSALHGPTYATTAMAELFSDRARLRQMLRVEAALARAEAQHGLVPEGLAPAIEQISADRLDVARLGQEAATAGIPVIPFVKAVQALLPPGLEGDFHRGATSQDIADTALVLQIREAVDLLQADLVAVLRGLEALATAHRNTPCAGRTFGQHAAPISFGYAVALWLSGIADVAAELPRRRGRVLVVSLGGPVGTLAGLGADGPKVVASFAAALDLGTSPVPWHVLRARMVEIGVWLATLIGALAKMATDVAHLASTEVAEVAEPHGLGRGGSSAMPHKRNPVSAGIILAAQAAATGHVATLLAAMAASHQRPVGLWHAEFHALPPLFGLASGALREARRLAEGLVVEPGRMRDNLAATGGLIFAEAVAARLAPRIGRQAAHAVVEQAADTAREIGRPFRDLLAEQESIAPTLLDAAFDLAPALAAAAAVVDHAVDQARSVRAVLDPDGA